MDEMITEKTMAADPIDEQAAKAAAAKNPYEPQPRQPQYQQPQYQQPQYQQPQYQQQQYRQPQYQQPQYRQPQYHQPYTRPQPIEGGGAAKAFAIVSFVAGCISLLLALFFIIGVSAIRETSSRAGISAAFLVYSVIISVPGLIFGIVSLAKRTRLFALGLMGVIFNGVLILAPFVGLLANIR